MVIFPFEWHVIKYHKIDQDGRLGKYMKERKRRNDKRERKSMCLPSWNLPLSPSHNSFLQRERVLKKPFNYFAGACTFWKKKKKIQASLYTLKICNWVFAIEIPINHYYRDSKDKLFT